MKYHQNHMWCSACHWDDENFDSRRIISIPKYDDNKDQSDPTFMEHTDDWKALTHKKDYFDQESYDRRVALVGKKVTLTEEVLEIEKEFHQRDVYCLNDDVIDWLQENAMPNPKTGEHGWAMGNDSYRFRDSMSLDIWFYRRQDALNFVKRWSIHKKPLIYFDYFRDLHKTLNLKTGKYEIRGEIMSATERNKGKLIPVDIGTLSEEQKEDPWDHDLMMIHGKFYKPVYEVKRDTYFDICEVEQHEDGSISFHTMHYNGGASLEEVIESGMK